MITYKQIMKELGINIISAESSQKCYYNAMNSKKPSQQGIKINEIGRLQKPKNSVCFLRYRDRVLEIEFLPQNQANAQMGVIYT
jgi:hypothetical protein